MTPEQLMNPRYKVIADYPENDIEVGTVLTCLPNGTITDFKQYEFKQSKSFFKKYPHLFKPLQWWEDREVSEMPEYVKADGIVYQNGVEESRVAIFNVEWKFDEVLMVKIAGDSKVWVKAFSDSQKLTPATLADYTAYINQNKNQ